MRRIYTRTGDRGTTAIHGGERVAKTHQRIEANGTLDELNVAIGMVRTAMPASHPMQAALKAIQLNLMTIMSRVATPSARRDSNPNRLPEGLVDEVERLIDSVASECSEAAHFILPGGTPVSAWLHQARVTARRAERELWRLNDADPVEEDVLTYVNRLSDLFFIMARAEMEREDVGEERWRNFSYNRVKK